MAYGQSWVVKRPRVPLLTRVLIARGIDTPEKMRSFLEDEGALADPFRLAGMQAAVSRLARALDEGERIVVYGDFDTDGVCATAVLVSALELLGAHVEAYIPDRFSESYGLNEHALEQLKHDKGAQVVVTVDCGIRAVAQVQFANQLGLDIIITDHHTVPDELPAAVAVINPKRVDSQYPFKELSGAGVAYRLVEALFSGAARDGTKEGNTLRPEQFLDLVALGTIADIVPLVDENRLLAKRGIQRLRETARPGLLELMQNSGVEPSRLDSTDVAFRLSPRLNAAGRLESASLAYELLTTRSTARASELASRLGDINDRRRTMLEQQVDLARALVGPEVGRRLMFVSDPGFHEGIVGLVASRLTDAYHRPALVMRCVNETTRGSARSIEGFHITRALDHCSDLLMRHGGHARAAGFTLATEHVGEFRERMYAYCQHNMDEKILQRRYSVDAIVKLDEIDADTVTELTKLEPVGEGNREPSLATVGLTLESYRCVGQERTHLKLGLCHGSRRVSAIAFRQGDSAEALRLGDRLDVIHRPQVDEWDGALRLQLVVSTFRVWPRVLVVQGNGDKATISALEGADLNVETSLPGEMARQRAVSFRPDILLVDSGADETRWRADLERLSDTNSGSPARLLPSVVLAIRPGAEQGPGPNANKAPLNADLLVARIRAALSQELTGPHDDVEGIRQRRSILHLGHQ